MAAQILEQSHEPGYRLLRAAVEQRNLAGRRGGERLGEGAAGGLGIDRDTCLRAVADAAARRVEDAAQADGVTGVVQHPKVGDDVTDLPAFVEPHPADHLVGDAGADEDLLHGARRVIGAVENGHVVVREVTAIDQFIDLGGHEPGLVVLVVGDVADDRLAVPGVSPQFLLPPARVARDHRVGRREDGLRGAVVLLQQDRGGVGEVALEVLDVADRRTPEGIDRLVGVAHHAQFRGRYAVVFHSGVGAAHPDQLAHQHVLGVIGVLVLVDQDVAEAPPVVLGDLRVALQQRHRLADQVVEVQRVGRPQPALVLGVDLGDDPGEVIGGLVQGGRRPAGSDQLVLEVGDRVGQQPRRVPLDVDAHIAADHQQQPAGVVGVVDGEVRVQPVQQRGLIAQNPHTGGVKRRHPHIPRPRADQGGHPLAHLRGGLVGERDGQDLPGADVAGRQQVGDAAGQHRRLTRPRTGHDQQRGTLVQDGPVLLGIESVEQSGLVVGRLNSHDAPNLPPPPDAPLRRHARGWHTLGRAQHAAIFPRVPVHGARGDVAAQRHSPAVRHRTRGSSV